MINRNVENVSVVFFFQWACLETRTTTLPEEWLHHVQTKYSIAYLTMSPPPPAHRRLVLVQSAVTATSAASELEGLIEQSVHSRMYAYVLNFMGTDPRTIFCSFFSGLFEQSEHSRMTAYVLNFMGTDPRTIFCSFFFLSVEIKRSGGKMKYNNLTLLP